MGSERCRRCRHQVVNSVLPSVLFVCLLSVTVCVHELPSGCLSPSQRERQSVVSVVAALSKSTTHDEHANYVDD